MTFYFDNRLVPSPLSHLPDVIIKTIIARYYAGDKVKQIVEDYQLPDHLSVALFSHFPFVLDDKDCKLCNKQLTRCFLEKPEQNTRLSKPFCEFCVSKSLIYKTTGHYCEGAYKEICAEDLAIRKFIKKHKVKKPTYDMYSVSLKDILHITVLIDAAKKIEPNVILELYRNPCITPFFANEVFNNLIKNKKIFYHKEYNLHAFSFLNGEIKCINNFKMIWGINLPEYFSTTDQFKSFTFNPACIETLDYEIKDEWTSIAIEECLEYYVFVAYQCHFEIEITTELINTLTKLLEKLSTSQCFKLIWSSCRSVNKDEVASRSQLGELSFTILKSMAEHHLSNNIDVPILNRPKEVPRSRISMILFNRFLKFEGDAAFYEVPKMIPLYGLF